MTGAPPDPPREIPDEFVQWIEEQPPDRIRSVARYAGELAESRERERAPEPGAETEREGGSEDGSSRPDAADDRPDDPPDGVPGRATLTVKEINDNRYYYWQWRDGDQIKSKYERPVDPDE